MASAGDKRVAGAGKAGASSLRSRRTQRPDVRRRGRPHPRREVEVVRAQLVVAEGDIPVTVHVEIHEGRLIVEAAEQSLLRPSRAASVRQLHAVTAGRCPATGARHQELLRQRAAQKAVRHAAVVERPEPN